MNLLQLKASDPEFSTWVSASAGTGKTKILTDRILRLLLKNVPLNKILCLTFTNAAAAEMQERLTAALSSWSMINIKDLAINIKNSFNLDLTTDQLLYAKGLYNLYLKSHDQINIYTIHSFCQKILKKFPIEAGISPNFKIIADTKTFEIIKEIKKKIDQSPELEPVNNFFAQNFHEVTIDEIFNEIIIQKVKFLCNKNLSKNIYEQQIALIADLEKPPTDQKYVLILNHSLIQNFIGIESTICQLKAFFLTSLGEKKKRIVPEKIAKQGSNLYIELEKIQDIIYHLDQEEKHFYLEHYSKLFAIFARQIINEYEAYKLLHGFLDYDDLIQKTKILLKDSKAKEWVLYKLDGGIDHLLVDEAQDTSPTQWQIINALIEEFYSGETKLNIDRTMFVVGDEKQSIFSFQGADVDSFLKMNHFFNTKLKAASKKFSNINLEISYRSAKDIIYVVDKICEKLKLQNPELFFNALPSITPFREEEKGSVELWPLISDNVTEDLFWPRDNMNKVTKSSRSLLAEKIATYIFNKIASNRILPSTKQKISAADFMILFRKRDEFTLDVIKAIKDKGLEVSGLDRIMLRDNLAVRDLISVAKYVTNNENDLNLAALLKSSIIGSSEDDLYHLIMNKGEKSLNEYVALMYPQIYTQLNLYNKLYKNLNVSNFFHYICEVLHLRTTLVQNCGFDSNDAINELLYLCQNYSQNFDVSLQNFLFWFEEYPAFVKRDYENTDKIKVMTVHASKGLQSPYVILCDTTSIPTNLDYFTWDNSKVLFAKNASNTPGYYKDLRSKQQIAALGEYLRLLYVGMTRAEDHLIICGYLRGQKLSENCWYDLVYNVIKHITLPDKDGHYIYGSEDKVENINLIDKKSKGIIYIQNYYNNNFELNHYDKILYTSSPLLNNQIVEYGLIFHKILEDAIKLKDLAIMQTHPLINTLNIAFKEKIFKSIKLIQRNEEFLSLLKNSIKTEITFGVSEKNDIKVGRVDLAVFCKDKIIIIDYKSDSNPPLNCQDIKEQYKSQLSFYLESFKKIYVKYIIETYILWLENGNLMFIL